MKQYSSENIKNVALVGHSGSGKTTLTEAMLFEAGRIQRRGTIEGKSTVSDCNEMEHERESSIYSALLSMEWKDSKINLIDTPGFDDFVGEVTTSLKVVDTVVMVVNGQHGVEVGTGVQWRHAKEHNKPVVFAINQMDHENVNMENTIEQLKNSFGRKVTQVQYPLNPGSGFNAIIDVLRMVMYKFPDGGGKPEKADIPEEEMAKAEQMHNELVENVAEVDEGLMELFFEKGTLEEAEMAKGLKIALIKRELFPVFCMSAKKNMGSGRLMGFIDNVAPSASEMPPAAINEGEELTCDPKGDTCIFIYKTVSEANLGDMFFFKVYSGELKTGMELVNETTQSTERFNQLYFISGKTRENADLLTAGDIGATVKLKNSHFNNTLHTKGKKIAIEIITFPEPTVRAAVTSAAKGQEDKLANAMKQLREEDPSITIGYVPELKQTIIAAQGELQLNLIKAKLEKQKIEIAYSEPKIPYRETIQKDFSTSYRHKKQSGGAGQFAEVHMRIDPYTEGMPDPPKLKVRKKEMIELPWGGNLEYVNCIVGGSIDVRFLPAILKGIMEKMEDGPITGSCVRDVRVIIFDGKMHPVDSNDMAFKTAGLMAFKDAFLHANPVLLEPIYEVEVLVPDEMRSDVMSDLQTKRAVVMGMDMEGNFQKITAKVPLAELHNYASTLRSLSQGTAKHRQKYDSYERVPNDIQRKLAKSNEAELEEA